MKCQSDNGQNYEFDATTLNSDGTLRVTAVADGICTVPADDAIVDVYTINGLRILSAVPYGQALRSLPAGVYVVGNRKVVVR